MRKPPKRPGAFDTFGQLLSDPFYDDVRNRLSQDNSAFKTFASSLNASPSAAALSLEERVRLQLQDAPPSPGDLAAMITIGSVPERYIEQARKVAAALEADYERSKLFERRVTQVLSNPFQQLFSQTTGFSSLTNAILEFQDEFKLGDEKLRHLASELTEFEKATAGAETLSTDTESRFKFINVLCEYCSSVIDYMDRLNQVSPTAHAICLQALFWTVITLANLVTGLSQLDNLSDNEKDLLTKTYDKFCNMQNSNYHMVVTPKAPVRNAPNGKAAIVHNLVGQEEVAVGRKQGSWYFIETWVSEGHETTVCKSGWVERRNLAPLN